MIKTANKLKIKCHILNLCYINRICNSLKFASDNIIFLFYFINLDYIITLIVTVQIL